MDIQPITTYVAAAENRGGGVAAYFEENTSFVANTSIESRYFLAPVSGKLVAGAVQGSVTSDGTKTYTFEVTNVTTSKTMVASTLLDDAPILTAGTQVALIPSTTAADVAVTKGDFIKVDFTGGTGSGLSAVLLTFEG